MRVAVPRKGQRTPLLHLLLVAVMATLAAGVTSGSVATRPVEATETPDSPSHEGAE